MPHLDPNSFLVEMLAGAVGAGYLLYGRKQSQPVPLICGVALIAYPYFVDNIWLRLGIGVALCLAPYFIRTEAHL